MFRTLKIPIGLTIALSMSVLIIAVALVNRLDHHESVVTVVKNNTAALSNSLALQLSVMMERNPGNNALFSSLFQPIKEHEHLLSAFLYDNHFNVISAVQPERVLEISNASLPTSPQNVPFGISQYEGVIVDHQIVGSSLYPMGHIVIYIDINNI